MTNDEKRAVRRLVKALKELSAWWPRTDRPSKLVRLKYEDAVWLAEESLVEWEQSNINVDAQ